MAIEITSWIVRIAAGLYILALVMHFLLKLSNADQYNPITQHIVRWTGPAVRPLAALLPTLGRFDLAIVVTALLISMGTTVLLSLLHHNGLFFNPLPLLLWSGLGLLYMVADIYFFAVLAVIILSWVATDGQAPAIRLLLQLTEPVMGPLRRVMPALGGLDLSPILLFVVINLVEVMLSNIARSVGLPARLVIGI